MTRVFNGIVWVAGFALVCAAGETFQCTQKIEAYDPGQPDKQLGFFEASSSLEIEDYVPEAKMYRVLYKTPDGKEIRALCRPESLGKTAPGAGDKQEAAPKRGFPSESDTTPSTEKEADTPPRGVPSSPQGAGRASEPPPVFVALKDFESSIWETPSSKFALMQGSHGFKWVSATGNNESRCDQPLRFLEQPVIETLARFQNDKLGEVKLLIFGRGDTRVDMDEEAFQQAMKSIEAQLGKWTGAKGLDAWVPGNAADTKRKSWFKAPLRVDLEYAFTRNAKEQFGWETRNIRFRAEFIRLAITPYDGKTDVAQLVKPNYQSSAQVTSVRKADLKERVKKDESGDVYLDGVPMVDQGQKGYCVCASMERVARFYGLDVDQNEMAKTANTLTQGGTSPDAMFKALKKLGGQFSMNVREHIGFDFQDFLKEIEAYNRVAKKNKGREIFIPKMGGVINLGEIYASMNPETLKEARLKKANDRTRFAKDLADLIDKGSPAFWGVELGLVEESPALPQARGGHMRLIIGYNSKKNEILYSDSWGAGHELKRMSMDDAFTITMSLYSVTPGS